MFESPNQIAFEIALDEELLRDIMTKAAKLEGNSVYMLTSLDDEKELVKLARKINRDARVSMVDVHWDQEKENIYIKFQGGNSLALCRCYDH